MRDEHGRGDGKGRKPFTLNYFGQSLHVHSLLTGVVDTQTCNTQVMKWSR